MSIIIDSANVKKQVKEICNFFSKDSIDEISKETKFVQRDSKLDGTIFLSIFTLGMTVYGKPILQELLGLINLIIPEFEISREGLHQRINDYAVKFFEFMLSQAINISTTKIDLNLLSNFERVLILDSTSIELPKELSDSFRGSGGGASTSALKIQFCFDLKLGSFFYYLQEGISPDGKYENSFVDKINKNDLIIKDLGYFNPKAFIELSDKGAYYLSRWKSNVGIYVKSIEGTFSVLDMKSFLSNLDSLTELEIYIKKDNDFAKARLVIDKVPEEVKNTRLRKLNKISQKKGQQTKDLTKIFQGFNVYVSNIIDLPKENFRKFYTLRWQIELVFKNWKSNFKLEKVSGIKIQRVKCMIYSKLLMIIISTKLIYQIRNICWKEFKIEISEFKASKHFILTFQEFFKYVIHNKSQCIFNLLNQTIEFIAKKCNKIPQKDRSYPLDIIESIALA